MTDHGLLSPGTHRADPLTDDVAFLRCLVEVEVAWVRAQAVVGLLADRHADAVARVLEPRIWDRAFDATDIAVRAEGGGNPVIPMLSDLRAAVRELDPQAVAAVHRGLTSQDVMDTAMMLMAARCLEAIDVDLDAVSGALAKLSRNHRRTPVVTRTLTQFALPSTFGLRCARWLNGVLDAQAELAGQRPVLSVGGAAGTLAGTAALVTTSVATSDQEPEASPSDTVPEAVDHLCRSWAVELGLAPAPHVWHTTRGPVLQLAAALAGVSTALGAIANDVLFLSRPEVAELREPSAPGRGVSSAMPQKQNPVLSVLLKRSALVTPSMVSQLFVSAASSVDERPDGGWHAEWSATRELLRHVRTAASVARELVEGLQVFPERMAANLDSAGPGVVAERIAAVLGPVAAGPSGDGKSAVQKAIGQGGGDTEDTVDLLLELTGGAHLADGTEVTRDVVADLCDPTRYTGLNDHLIDAALHRREQATTTTSLAGGTGGDGPDRSNHPNHQSAQEEQR